VAKDSGLTSKLGLSQELESLGVGQIETSHHVIFWIAFWILFKVGKVLNSNWLHIFISYNWSHIIDRFFFAIVTLLISRDLIDDWYDSD
jgi:hypothetical protein